MAQKNDFAKRAEDLLSARRDAVQQLGELLDQKAAQEAALAKIEGQIEDAVAECLSAGWKPTELSEIGIPRSSMRRARPDKPSTPRPASSTPAPTGEEPNN